MGKFKVVVFGKDELEYRKKSKLKALLTPLANKNSDSNVRQKVYEFFFEHKKNLLKENLSIDT